MHIQKYLTIVIVLVGLQAFSQTPTSAIPSPAQNSEAESGDSTKQTTGEAHDSPPISDDLSMPASIPLLNQSTVEFSSELQQSNYISGGVSLGTTFDDNALNTTSGRISNLAYSFFPLIALDQTRSRLKWKLNYAGGVVLNENLSTSNQASHNLNLEGKYRLSPHVSLLVRDHFIRTTGFYDHINQDITALSGGLLQRPNQFVITPFAEQTGNIASAQVDYQFGRDSTIGGSASFNRLHYGNVPATSSQLATSNLIDSQTVQGQAYYNHRILSNNWLGLTYSYQRLTFSTVEERALVHSVFVTDTIYFGSNVTLALFVGPGQQNVRSATNELFTDVGSQRTPRPISSKLWSVAGGGTFNWNGKRNSFVADGSRMVSDGGGLSGAVQLISATGAFRRQLTRSFSSELGVMYGNSSALSTLTGPTSSLKLLSAKLSISRTLGSSLLLTLGYSRDLQQQYQGMGLARVNHNRVLTTVSYNFRRPLR